MAAIIAGTGAAAPGERRGVAPGAQLVVGASATGILCEAHLYVLETNRLIDISPVPPIIGPEANLEIGGYGDDWLWARDGQHDHVNGGRGYDRYRYDQSIDVKIAVEAKM